MARKEPMLNEGANKILIIVILAAVMFAALMVYYDPAPNPKEPACKDGEVAMLTRDGWFCVQARKP